jgi:hypothetical protein
MTARHKALWLTLQEPREVTLGFVLGYLSLTAGGIGVLASDYGTLPVGVWSARMVSGAAFAAGGLLAAPTAWFGWWWVERIGVAILGFGFVSRLLAVIGMGDVLDDGQMALAVSAQLALFFMAAARFAWVEISPYRYGAGPMLPEAEAGLSKERAEQAEREHNA